MRIECLEVSDFRSLRRVTWRPGDLNLLIGANASGKSNLLQFLELLSASSRGVLGDWIVRAGGMEPLVWDGVAPGFGFRLEASPPFPNRDSARDSLTYSMFIARIGASSAARVDSEELANYCRVKAGETARPLILLTRNRSRAMVFDNEERGLAAPEDAVPEEESLLSLAAGPFSANRLIPQFQARLAGWLVYQEFRTDRDAPVRQPALARHDAAVSAGGGNLVSVLHTLYTGDRGFEETVNAAMSAAFEEDFDRLIFPPAADGRIQLRLRWKSLRREQSASDLSDGTLRFLFLLAILADPSPPGLIAIDEPETGLHPSMLPIVAEQAREAARRSQVILTTHSPELLDAFTEFRPTTTVVHRREGETVLRVLAGEDLERWLRAYTLGTIYRSGELEAMESAA